MVFSRYFMKPDSCFDMLMHFSMSMVEASLFMNFRSVPIISIDLTSPQDPFDMIRKRTNSLVDDRSCPSAMLFIIEMEALHI